MDRVVEIASNDGYLLRYAAERGAAVLGVDPAENIARHANASGVPTMCAYFDENTALRIRDDLGPADVIFANNVLAHVPDPNNIVAGIRLLLAEDGLAHLEMPSLLRLIESRAFDTIYHEHYSYFSACALRTLFDQHGLRIVDLHEIDIHGGSFHVTVAHNGDENQAEAMCEDERSRGIFSDNYYADFSHRVMELKEGLLAAFGEFSSVTAFGAAAKGIVLLNCFGLDAEVIPWVADVSPHKQGRFVPGTRQIIVEPERLLHDMPDACLILPWNIRSEICRRNHDYTNRGGRFIVAIPEIAVL